MNPKQTAPLLVTLAPLAAVAPPLIMGGAIGLGIVLLLKAVLSADKQAQPDAAAVEASTDTQKPAETVVFRQIPAEIPSKPASVPRPVVLSSAVKPVVSAPVLAPRRIAAPLPSLPPNKRKIVGREDVAAIFQDGTRTFSRTDAVSALKWLGFGKTAAYAALSPDGRFAAWLHCAPDGMIIWTD